MMSAQKTKRFVKVNAGSNADITRKVILLEKKIERLQLENALLKKLKQTNKDSQSKYRSLFEMSDDAILVIENEKFVDCNKAVVKMLGYKTKRQVLNTHPSELSPLRQPDGVPSFEKAQMMIELAIKKGSHHFEWIHTRANGQNFPVEVWLCSFKHKGKTLINTIWRDLTEKKKAEQLILKNIEEKEIMLKEIHHRVKNNLQIISSLLNLQSFSLDNDVLKEILQQSKFRVESMAKIHEMLYQSKDLSKICFADYVKQLTSNLIKSAKGAKNNITTSIDIDKVFFTINTAIPLGLIINEFVSNSLKHGIKNDLPGTISIRILKKKDEMFELLVSDDGVGYAQEFTPENMNTLGFQLVFSLADQIDASIRKIASKKGTSYVLRFYNSNKQPAFAND